MTAQTTIPEKPAVQFSKNWNKKLNCDFFPTLRPTNQQKFYVGAVHRVVVADIYAFDAQIHSITNVFLKDLPAIICYLDAAMSQQETSAMFRQLYPTYDFDKYTISIIIYRKLD